MYLNLFDPPEKADYFDGVLNYLNKMLMEEEEEDDDNDDDLNLPNKPSMLALQATEKSFHDVLHPPHCHRFEAYDAALLCEDFNRLLIRNTSLSAGNMRKKRRKDAVEEMVDLRELYQCAEATASNDTALAIQILKTIRRHSSPYGSSSMRMAHYFANAIEARLAGIGTQVYQALSSTTASAAQILSCYKAHINMCPFRRMSNIFANKSIMKHANGRDKLHIIDFGILHGFQWPCIIQGLSLRPGGPPMLRITGINLPQHGFRTSERVEETGRRLADYAKRFNVPFKYHLIVKNWENVRTEDLEIDPEEMLVVNSLYRMRNVLDETVVENRPRDAVLNFIRELNPSMFVHGVLNGTYNATYFLTRFREAAFHFTTLFDMFEATGKHEDKDRKLYEQEVYGREIMNVVACEGRSRVERPETYQKWEGRNSRAGFQKLGLDSDLVEEVRKKVKKKYHKEFVLDKDNDWMLQGWKGRVLYALSLWTPASSSHQPLYH